MPVCELIVHHAGGYATELVSVAIEQEDAADLHYYIDLPSGELLYRIDAVTNSRAFYHDDEMANTIAVIDDGGAVIGTYATRPTDRCCPRPEDSTTHSPGSAHRG